MLADDPGQAWLRLWAQALVLAFLAGRPVPGVPAPLRAGGQALSPRGRECLLATVVEAAVRARAGALRPCYDPRRLTAVVATVAGRMLADGDAVPARGGLRLGHPAASLAARDGAAQPARPRPPPPR